MPLGARPTGVPMCQIAAVLDLGAANNPVRVCCVHAFRPNPDPSNTSSNTRGRLIDLRRKALFSLISPTATSTHRDPTLTR